ncbi:MAG: S-methyl-5-thioribose-1-phosphate isomerase [Candidatus Terraquivivens tikiterensis]|uniref:Putative methylthioribose-1-phosphate isomerase n=1 Tax=Candidatus Terraquivivens tikiterensis TaxID=1980982 RepID=A0A2R7Y9J9_9ARCH|nr:MAG: S-methyl-5-thioribose-1-phosphate isomerase [Candidatus Terraquivivens tikiterensis]
MPKELRTVLWVGNRVKLIDQRKLPSKLVYISCKSYRDVALAIKSMAVRGAPAIGVAAAMGMALAAKHGRNRTIGELMSRLERAKEVLASTRPTAVNLYWALDRVMRVAREAARSGSVESVVLSVLEEAKRMADEDVEVNRALGKQGSTLIRDGDTVLTHCNAGSLATVCYGTALGVIRAALEEGKSISVIATETRPKLQGARLTAFELKTMGVPFKLITDGMVGYAMQQGLVSKVLVGADRVLAKSGHVVNKIGTLTIAIAAKHFGIPFYVAAPTSTLDFESSPEDVVIEFRDEEEVHYVGRTRITPKGVKAMNPAFDVTPPELVTAVITERGIYEPTRLMELRQG